MKNPRCRNCAHCSHTLEGYSWCAKQIQYTDSDGSCSSFQPRQFVAWGMLIALVLAFVAFVFTLVNLFG